MEITEVSRRGDGIARIQGFVIFVTDAKKGESHRIKITKVSNRFATAEIVKSSKEE